MKLWKAISLLLLSLMVTGCVTYIDPIRYGTYTYKGVQYDVYTVTATEDEDRGDDTEVRILVPKGTSPSKLRNIRPISVCNMDRTNQKDCDKRFARAIDMMNAPKESGSDY